ncbi:MAG: hypothetical protein KGL57_11715 [Burkholderiales bacterium]|nr:hypothetical protein [Burkholderiales bacterium]
MNRLQAELRRLYALDTHESGQACLADAPGRVRAMVLALSQPADWSALSKVWQGVQTAFNWPAPAIAVNGVDGYQLWFSLAELLPLDQAVNAVQALAAHFLPDVAPERLSLWPAASPLATAVPPIETLTDQWAAFVAHDLAPVFADTPWLDVPPSLDGQADLLSRLASIQSADLQAAILQLTPQAPHIDNNPEVSARALVRPSLDPKQFLLQVMNNEAVALSLRIEAAKALLPYFEPPR